MNVRDRLNAATAESYLLRDEIAKLTADLAACEKMKLGYYGEAQEGWSKFREAEREIDRLRSLLTEVRGCQRLWIEPNAISVTIPRDLWKRLK